MNAPQIVQMGPERIALVEHIEQGPTHQFLLDLHRFFQTVFQQRQQWIELGRCS